MNKSFFVGLLGLVLFSSCGKDEETPPPTDGPNIIFKFKFDSTQARLNAIGQPAAMPAGNAGLSPVFNGMGAHYIELAPDAWTALGAGKVLYKAPETTAGGSTAIDFEKSAVTPDGGTFFTMKLKDITPGTYEWLRISLAYQNYDVKYHVDTTIAGIPWAGMYNLTIASFIGYNSYLKSYKIKNDTITVNGNRKQGYWAYENNFTFAGVDYHQKGSDQAPEGATTVVNPIAGTSPIPKGSCVVTAAFTPGKLVVTGTETKDITIEVSLSTNKSFEWKEVIKNGVWDLTKGEKVVDMGIRGMTPKLQ